MALEAAAARAEGGQRLSGRRRRRRWHGWPRWLSARAEREDRQQHREMQAAVGWEAKCRARFHTARNRSLKISGESRAPQQARHDHEALCDASSCSGRGNSRRAALDAAEPAQSARDRAHGGRWSPWAAAEPPPPSPRAKIHTPPWLRAGLEVRTPDDAASASSGSELPTPAESPLTPLLLKPTQPMMCADCGELYSPPSCTTCRCAALAKVSLGKPRQVTVPADAVWPAVARGGCAACCGARRGGGTVVAALAAEVDLGGGAAARAGQPADVAVGRQRPRAKTWAAAGRRRRFVIGLEARPQSRGHSCGRRRRRRLRARPRRPDDRRRVEKHGSLARRSIESTRVHMISPRAPPRAL